MRFSKNLNCLTLSKLSLIVWKYVLSTEPQTWTYIIYIVIGSILSNCYKLGNRLKCRLDRVVYLFDWFYLFQKVGWK